MEEIKIDNDCCGKQMIAISPEGNNYGEDRNMWICADCGAYYTLVEGQLDEEELDNYKDNYPKEFGIKEDD